MTKKEKSFIYKSHKLAFFVRIPKQFPCFLPLVFFVPPLLQFPPSPRIYALFDMDFERSRCDF